MSRIQAQAQLSLGCSIVGIPRKEEVDPGGPALPFCSPERAIRFSKRVQATVTTNATFSAGAFFDVCLADCVRDVYEASVAGAGLSRAGMEEIRKRHRRGRRRERKEEEEEEEEEDFAVLVFYFESFDTMQVRVFPYMCVSQQKK